MGRYILSAVAAAAMLIANAAFAGVTSGQVAARDRDRQIVQLVDGTTYYVPNRVYLRDFRPKRFVTIWYKEENGQRVVVNHEVKRGRDD